MFKIAITPGDRDGIGPEVTAKALREWRGDACTFLLFGNEAALRAQGLVPSERVRIIPPKSGSPGAEAGRSIEQAVEAIQRGDAEALVTGPISKERLQKGGYKFVGHTDFLAALAQHWAPKGPGQAPKGSTPRPAVTMMLANDHLRVSLATVHCALKDVAKKLTPSQLEQTIQNTVAGLKSLYGISKPKVAILGLNPHAGENGLLGSEEKKILIPAIKRWQKRADVVGPFPADTYFATVHGQLKPDAVVAMYHDQGLIPVKMLDFAHTYNVTLGLPFIRTSVDHGTAFDIAGQDKADPSSMISAIRAALRMAKIHEVRTDHFQRV